MSIGVGLTVTLRVRIAAHDAHYAGELVDGARMLALFGDVATELLIRLDGDEGLFRAYEAVEFLAPVRAGDYIEATGIITKVGNTSRTMAFEARKVVANVREPGLAPSAADALSEPVVVCRAIGTCVVPKEMQRRPRLILPALSAPAADLVAGLPEPRPIITPAPHVIVTPPASELILTAAIVGAEVTREHTPHLPITAAELADEAARCRDAGAAVIHLHVRNPDGTASQSTDLFGEAIARIREKTDVIIQTSTGGAVGMSIEERLGPLPHRPEMATLNCGSLNFGDDVFVNTRPDIRAIAKRLRDAGSIAELECYEVGHIHEALALFKDGHLVEPLHFQFVLGVPGGIAATEDVVRFMLSQIPQGATWAVAAVGRHQRPMTELAMRLGGHARVGLEDNIYLEKGVLAEGSAPLVARAAAYAKSIGREVVDPDRARKLLGIVTSAS
ncbi:3-keto-5-aminohexanoate cleavage protein [Polyangium aurulentum]|uniref:bifunctional 3-aminobutyryl-CoA ammonia lyase/3-keto-5-aminohexanoate cleavage enzyme n=1 Tax=Polyangium aurulentum TaxID=2567896 RepID=UPI0010AEC1A9|nr:3-keto-5-aminohexanoate cleavage protein [Polyangium aurulentum]UQA63318.1 3-keto-5-aminohexanoate cleavage protein [Polyangium aurulentum]